MTDEAGAKVAAQEYIPFGMARGTANVTSETNYQYTGQEYDAETGLYWYGSRYYDPMIGRFLMADTMVSDMTDTQALNPYSYCLNNPLKYTDPTGHSVKEKKAWMFTEDLLLNRHLIITTVIAAVSLTIIITGIIIVLGSQLAPYFSGLKLALPKEMAYQSTSFKPLEWDMLLYLLELSYRL